MTTPTQIPEDHNDRVALIAKLGLKMPESRTKENVIAVLQKHFGSTPAQPAATPPPSPTDGHSAPPPPAPPANEKAAAADPVRPQLVGMKAIADYIGRSHVTVLQYVNTYDFPAAKVGGIWEADPAAVDAWRAKQQD